MLFVWVLVGKKIGFFVFVMFLMFVCVYVCPYMHVCLCLLWVKSVCVIKKKLITKKIICLQTT